MTVRNARASELEQLATIWFDGWQDAHARRLPASLAKRRTHASFQERLPAAWDRVRVIGSVGMSTGFCFTRPSELYQVDVSSESRGTGVLKAHLACGIGNERAASFYEKRGWFCAGIVIERLATGSGTFPLEVWRYEKVLQPADRSV